MNITADTVQEFLSQFRDGYYVFTEGEYKLAYSNRFGDNSVKASSWESLLNRCIDKHDKSEMNWLAERNISLD